MKLKNTEHSPVCQFVALLSTNIELEACISQLIK